MGDWMRDEIREMAERREQLYRERDAQAARSLAAAQNHTLLRTPRGSNWPFPLQIGKARRGVDLQVSDVSSLRVIALAVGRTHALALRSDGTIVAWGAKMRFPDGLDDVVAIAAGENHSMALRGNGTVVAWGSNEYGQADVPAGLTGVVAISANHGHSLALRDDGAVVAWGANDSGQSCVPAGLKEVVAIAAGWWHSVALKNDGSVIAWGHPDSDQRHVPWGLVGAVAIAAGFENSSAILYDGSVFDWGVDQDFMETPPSFTEVIEIAYGENHRVALRADGTLVAQGTDSGGIEIPSDLPSVAAIVGAASHFLALTVDGEVRSLGLQGVDNAVMRIPPGLSRPVPSVGLRVDAHATSLMKCASLGDVAGVRRAIDSGAHVDAVDSDGDGVLRYVMGSRNSLILRRLLAAGADPNGVSTLANGASGYRILHAFAEFGWTEGIQCLIDYGAVVDIRGPGGVTPIMLAAGAGRDSAIVELGVAGALVNFPDDDGDSALYYAASRGRRGAVARLLALGAKLEGGGGKSGSPVMVAANCASPLGNRPDGTLPSDYAAVVVELLRAGADPSEMYAAGLALCQSGDFGMIPNVDSVLDAVHEHDFWRVIYLTPSGYADRFGD